MSGRALDFCLRFTAFALFFALCALGLAAFFNSCVYIDDSVPASAEATVKIIIDAGHGGADGGAAASDGTQESGLNLDTAIRLRDLFEVCGFDAVMTREGDEMLDDGGSGTNKLRDLRARLKLAAESPDAVFVSLHMNKFPDSRYSGLQVWYSPNNASGQTIAASVQQSAKNLLDASNARQIKAATSAIYLLHNIQNPAILVECGFLSNEGELALLKTGEYRQKLAIAIAAGVIESYSMLT